MKKLLIIFIIFLFTGCGMKEKIKLDGNNKVILQEENNVGYIEDELEIKDMDGKNTNYEFVYRDEVYKVLYLNDTWKIYNSYKITNNSDMRKICRALVNIHKIPSSDYKSYRTVDDMVYEWKQHNLAFQVLPAGNSFRDSAKDVDLDPKDQGKSLVEMYEDRTGQKLDLGKIFNR